ncbi:glucose 1-dehydrogenase [Sphingosinicella ginsenosidimutans]|jgi:3(or 17)beta-hydroxysteroid dehydrogenase|uniref:SDR family oxidoreductase n=1 Tax=Allosphingosinicella ginsenosidimutans TaxID=1176539 RepID=A0A5C6TUI2_9SPHN|nr:SDR family oxidoreductase [Sphingosinicella ginsenosidimutans]TXC64052.1 SDR family oxidoreductase [Sphingosinicella ginsenosidimutans]
MSGRLAGKVAIITGAAKGLGAADARMFAAEGATVVLTDVDPEGQKVADEIGPTACFFHHDVRSEAAWAALVGDVERRFGRLDILVNNAGVVEVGTPESVTEADYRFIMSVSVDGVVWGCKHAIPAMRRAGGGSIVNMSSIAAAQGEPNVAAYVAAKGAVDAYTRAVAVYCGQLRLPIRCNAILPNGIITPMVQSIPAKRAAASGAGLISDLPGDRNDRGAPEDVAALVLFLASDESRWINGQSILVDNAASVTKGAIPSLQA